MSPLTLPPALHAAERIDRIRQRIGSLIGLLEEGVDSVVARSLYVDCNQKRVNVRPTLIN